MASAKERRPSKADFPFWLGETVYLRVAPEKNPGFVTAVVMRPGSAIYEVTWADGVSDHYGFELSDVFLPDYMSTDED